MDEHTRDDSIGPPPVPVTGWDPETGTWEHATLRRTVLHGVRLFNDGAYHESHDCFEAEWYQYGAGTTESAFLHGMTQVAAGAYKYIDHGEAGGLDSLFRTAGHYLVDVPDEFYGVNVADVRDRLEKALADPTAVVGWEITLDGKTPRATSEDYDYANRVD